MRITFLMRWVLIFAGCCPGRAVELYSPDPEHVWNRVYGALMVRTTSGGVLHDDLLDPPLWVRTKYLLEGESNRRAVKALQELVQDGEGLKRMSPTQRALMQRDLIGVFSWLIRGHAENSGGFFAVGEQQRELAKALARAIKHVALDAEAIRKLPDNYAAAVATGKAAAVFDPARPEQAYLPKDLLADDGAWLVLEPENYGVDGLAATLHFKAFLGRSAFEVRMRHPEGREAGEAYLKRLATMPKPFLFEKPGPPRKAADGFDEERGHLWINPATPQFPTHTIWALVRRAILADAKGAPIVSPLIESVQIRVYRKIEPFKLDLEPALLNAQMFFEWELSRKLTVSGGGFHQSEPGANFGHFMSKGYDPFESGWELRAKVKPSTLNCYTCHNDVGINSVPSRTRHFEGPQAWPAALRASSSRKIAERTEWEAAPLPVWALLRWLD